MLRSNLAELELEKLDLNSEQLEALLSSLPMLKHLSLRFMGSLTSLAFLASAPQLTHLTLVGCQSPSLSSRDLAHMHRLRSLTHLSIVSCFEHGLDDFTVALHSPPSALMPSLQHFTHSVRVTGVAHAASIHPPLRISPYLPSSSPLLLPPTHMIASSGRTNPAVLVQRANLLHC